MNNNITISKISKRFNDAYPYINHGSVISVFDKVINIITDRGLFAIQESSIPFTPFTILLADTNTVKDLKLEPNDKVYFKEKEIFSEKFKCTLDNVEVVDTTLSKVSDYLLFKSKVKWLINTLSSLLETRSMLNNSGLMDLAVHINIKDNHISIDSKLAKTNLLNYLKIKLINKDPFSEEFSVEIASLVGLGDGLTPSFDDFLVGLISCLKFSGCRNEKLQSLHNNLCRLIRSNLNNTTSVSAAFLDSAISNDFSEPMLNLYSSIDELDENKIKTALENITKIGHSSGIDSLNGILFGLKLIL